MRKISRICCALWLLACPALSQEFWDTKPWTSWSSSEVRRLLTDSPWSQSQTLASVAVDLGNGRVLRDPVASRAKERDYSNVVKLKYTAQFRSAQPVRRALVRQLELEKDYDELPPEKQRSFDERAARFLSPGNPEDVVVFVAFEVSVPAYNIELQRYWNAQTAATLASTVFLNLPGGHKLSPIKFASANGGFQFLFRRPEEPLPEGSATLQFDSPEFANIPAAHVLVSFPMKKMVANGGLLY
jgi:hypothetical protein